MKSQTIDTINICGLPVQAGKYVVKSRTKVTTRTGSNPKYKFAHIQLAIYHIQDTTCVYLDTIYHHMREYWKEREEWKRKYPGYGHTDTSSLNGDFSALPINEGFLKSGEEIIPFIEPGHGRVGTYCIYWFNQHLYKVVLLKSTGLGGIGFVGQNMRLVKNGAEFPFEGFATRQLEDIKELLKDENKINCATISN